MNYSELLQYQGYIYLNSIFEPEDNTLIIDIDRCKTNDIIVGENDTSSSYGSIYADETLPIIRLKFDWYIAYSIRNESFTTMDEYELYEGRVFSLYSKSRYLDFIEVGTIAGEIYPGPLKHYGINALNHIIDVISTEPPSISVIQRNDQKSKGNSRF
ncbi:hypothetical protein J7I93_22185 [Bacillus sp. ISL-47]|uniref:hypothetical protein n=1 Tax=Bacillus sp. ISL-47 TaxID=2819130 RepID=UPI001BE95943|nr:hypothetical protein [Bacillus sp. ISL-47]MBT2690851.1 hypothetical protein [Bacillus sp. ISL-47]MBT2710988.1 hypothetical protein [Pseudomonas sp. ISL-84]